MATRTNVVEQLITHLIAVDGAVDAGVEVRDLVVREPALVHVVGGDVGGAEVDVGLAGVGAANPGGSSDGAALLEGDELVEVVKIGEHFKWQKVRRRRLFISPGSILNFSIIGC